MRPYILAAMAAALVLALIVPAIAAPGKGSGNANGHIDGVPKGQVVEEPPPPPPPPDGEDPGEQEEPTLYDCVSYEGSAPEIREDVSVEEANTLEGGGFLCVENGQPLPADPDPDTPPDEDPPPDEELYHCVLYDADGGARYQEDVGGGPTIDNLESEGWWCAPESEPLPDSPYSFFDCVSYGNAAPQYLNHQTETERAELEGRGWLCVPEGETLPEDPDPEPVVLYNCVNFGVVGANDTQIKAGVTNSEALALSAGNWQCVGNWQPWPPIPPGDISTGYPPPT